MIETEKKTEKVILVAVSEKDEGKTLASLDELEALADTAGALVLEKFLQPREHPHPGTYLGSGKLEELKERICDLEADGIICDDELTPAQMRNMSDILNTKVMDRTLLILDIFAQRAATKEGSIQVELAQLRYRATRLTGKGQSLSRLGGGIGTRGPGESKLESDRRAIHRRISVLKAELEDVEAHRMTQRAQRVRNAVPVVAVVGYTNAGKSTLLNALTGSDILAEDKLFATLDPTTRKLTLPGAEEVLLTDTVGFINKLPHDLIDAFKSTLEEAKYADILLHVVDASDPEMRAHMETVYATLRDLKAEDKPILTAFNKCDRDLGEALLYDPQADETVRISALSGQGLEHLKEILQNLLRQQKVYLDRLFPYAQAGEAARVRKYGQVLEESYEDGGIHIKAYVPKRIAGEFTQE
ncbi:MAG: GTPase HflX [Lachnospiraceae bacterium]|nr:GTPase HflX [Lachnospiraceae bacterium]